MLTKANFQHAKAFIRSHARQLDQELFNFYFEGGSAKAVKEALATYQNSDGGFGHGLEQDIRAVVSSPICTTIAFQYLSEVGATVDDKLVQGGIAYFLETYNPQLQGWPLTLPTFNDAPHAIWWTYDPDKTWGNPDAEIVAYLNQYPLLVQPELLGEANKNAQAQIVALSDDVEMHVFLCLMRLLPYAPYLESKAKAWAQQLIETDTSVWEEYGLKPLTVFPSPTSPLASEFDTAIQANLAFEIAQQQDDGGWYPAWSWHDYLDVWAKVRFEIAGTLTVKMLRVFQNYGVIEGLA